MDSRHHSVSKRGIIIALLLVSTPCFAHGEQALVLPAANGLALVCFSAFLLCWRQRALFKVLALGALGLGIVLSWALPFLPHTIGALAGYSFSYIFAVGFGVPIAVAGLGCATMRLFRGAAKPETKD